MSPTFPSKRDMETILKSFDNLAWTTPGHNASAALWRTYGEQLKAVINAFYSDVNYGHPQGSDQ